MKSKITLIIMLIIMIILVVLCCIFGYKYSNIKKENGELDSQIETLNNELSVIKQEVENKENEEEEPQISKEESKIITIDQNKMELDGNYVYNGVLSYDIRTGIEATVVSNNSINFRTNEEAWTFFHNDGEYIQYSIENIDKKPIEVCISGASETLKAYFLMEDGTVRYISGSSIIAKETTLQNYEGLTDVVALRKIIVVRKNGGGNVVTVAIRSDGSSKVLI